MCFCLSHLATTTTRIQANDGNSSWFDYWPEILLNTDNGSDFNDAEFSDEEV